MQLPIEDVTQVVQVPQPFAALAVFGGLGYVPYGRVRGLDGAGLERRTGEVGWCWLEAVRRPGRGASGVTGAGVTGPGGTPLACAKGYEVFHGRVLGAAWLGPMEEGGWVGGERHCSWLKWVRACGEPVGLSALVSAEAEAGAVRLMDPGCVPAHRPASEPMGWPVKASRDGWTGD